MARNRWRSFIFAPGRRFDHVGKAHRKALFEALELDMAIDFTTLERLGNTGAVALPVTAAIGIEQGHVRRGDRVALLGIGSGINVVMLGVDWQRSPVERKPPISGPHKRPLRAGVEAR